MTKIGHNSAAYGQQPRTCFEILYATFEEEWDAPVYSEGELTDAQFDNGEIGEWEWDIADDVYRYSNEGGYYYASSPFQTPDFIPIAAFQINEPDIPYQKKPIPAELRWAVFRRDGYRCVHCGYDADLTADHIEPEVKGGRTGIDNLQTLCRPCNSKKGAR